MLLRNSQDPPKGLRRAASYLTAPTIIKTPKLFRRHFVQDRSARIVFIALLTISLCLLSLTESSAETRRALIVGINKYNIPKTPAPFTNCVGDEKSHRQDQSVSRRSSEKWDDLDGAVNDALAMREILTNLYQFPPENVLVLTDAEATREKICSAIRTHLIGAAVAGDVSLFYYAGHGSQVKNSLSDELDKKDESIVPSDGQDIRDKELARLFHKALDKGIVLTTIFDSCHSGSILRGEVVRAKTRYAPEDLNDAMDPPDPGPKPEERGALVLSAAQDTELAGEAFVESFLENRPHGAFTVGLLKALRNPQINSSARDVYASTTGYLRGMGDPQQPVLAGLPERQRSPLFGGKASVAGRLRVPIGVVSKEDRSLVLLGGYPIGLTLNSELTKVTGKKGTASTEPVRIRVSEALSMGLSRFTVISGRAQDIHPGDLFELDRWVPPQGAMVKAWLPPEMPTDDVAQVVEILMPLRAAAGITWVEDPTAVTPTHVLAWDGAVWRLSGSEGQGKDLGRTITAEEILNVLSSLEPPIRLFVRMPPPTELVWALKQGVDQSQISAEWASSPAHAHYLLSGSLTRKGVEYAWVLPNASTEDAQTRSLPLPIRADWVKTDLTVQSQRASSYQLEATLLQLAKLRGWLTLESPQDEQPFPYRLILKEAKPGGGEVTDRLDEGEIYELVLRADAEQLKQGIIPRRVYIILVSSNGEMDPLYPQKGQGDVENRFPLKREVGAPLPTVIPLTKIKVTEPFGIDTYILLATNEPIGDLTGLKSGPVTTRAGNTAAGSKSPLAMLLSQTGAATRANQTPVPTNWSVSQFSIRSVEKKK